ncbi:hypothetical protein HK097_002378 [Rhizophlyctis rosea]|uniref:Uncharacterized protein n=1 Tax=Rhizophlyctis rosea TaxID=64517 RepID=A0AAD5S3H4_9FUNG|nr:hypothetical protein HK097_002378 [Rhizophlyctis rosea]
MSRYRNWYKHSAPPDSTYVYETTTDSLAIGKYYPTGGNTAHQKITKAASYNKNECMGGSIGSDGTIRHRSYSLNETNFGQRDMSGTKEAQRVEEKIAHGDYKEV